MYTYRKKPVKVEAFQMTKERRWDNSEWPHWLHYAWQRMSSEKYALTIDPTCKLKERLCINTLEGDQLISWNDYIIRGIKGELYPCKPDIFEATYGV